MRFHPDDRGQAIQVGAAILLGFVVIAITMYQVNVVPGQNAEIEFDHSQAVQEDVQELRNAVTNAGTREHSESVAVSLGTRFPARTIFVNPPPAIGTLRTVEAGNVTIHNADVASGSSLGSNAEALLESEHRTARVLYEPNYREYRGGPTTVVEHSLAYNVFDDAALGLSRQRAVRGDRLQLTFLDGDLQEEGARTISVDAETVSGPTTLVPIEPEDESRPIELRLPVAAPEPWNESIGTTYGEGEVDARVAGYDENGTLTVELDRDAYELRMALVSVGENADETDRYDVGAGTAEGGSGGGSSPAYEVRWQNPSGQDGVDDGNCTADRCVVSGDEVDISIATAPVADGANVDYAVSDRSVGTITPRTGRTNTGGEHATTFELDSGAATGDTVLVYASSGSGSDTIELEIGERDPSAAVSARVEDLSRASQDGGRTRYYTSFEVSDPAGQHDRTAVTLRNVDSGATTVQDTSARRGTVSFEPGDTTGDRYEVEVVAYDDAGDVIASRTIDDPAADGTNPAGNDDLGDGTSPSLASSEVRDLSSQQDNVQYEVTYAVDGDGFGSVQLDLVVVGGSGAQDGLEDLPRESTGTLRTYGYWSSPNVRVTALVYDEDGVIVDAVAVRDRADGTDP